MGKKKAETVFLRAFCRATEAFVRDSGFVPSEGTNSLGRNRAGGGGRTRVSPRERDGRASGDSRGDDRSGVRVRVPPAPLRDESATRRGPTREPTAVLPRRGAREQPESCSQAGEVSKDRPGRCHGHAPRRRLRRDAPGVRSRVTLRPNLRVARPAVRPGRLLVTWTQDSLVTQASGDKSADSHLLPLVGWRAVGTAKIIEHFERDETNFFNQTSLVSPFTTPSSSSSASRPLCRRARRTAPPRHGTRARPSLGRCARHPARASSR